MLNIFYFFLSFILLFSFFSILGFSLKNGISPMPTSFKVKKVMLQIIKKNINENVKGDIAELGSGFLTLALPIASVFPKNKVIAYETSLVPYLISKVIVWIFSKTNIDLIRQDFFTVDLRNSGLIVCYLYPKAMEKLKLKFEKELKPGTWIISNTFAVPGWKPVKTVIVDDLYNTKIYLYKI